MDKSFAFVFKNKEQLQSFALVENLDFALGLSGFSDKVQIAMFKDVYEEIKTQGYFAKENILTNLDNLEDFGIASLRIVNAENAQELKDQVDYYLEF